MKKKRAMTMGYRKIFCRLRERWLTITFILLLVLSLLLIIQELSGALWKYERHLEVVTVIEQDRGAFRLSLKSFGRSVPERLRAAVQVLDDGSSLPRVRAKRQLLRSSSGFFVTGNTLWVKTRSGDPKNLVARFPVEVSGRPKALILGATLFALLGLIAWAPERRLWQSVLFHCLTASKGLSRRLPGLAVRYGSARPGINDLLAILLLSLIAAVIYFPRVNDFSHTVDGFHMSHLMEIGELPIYTVNEPKEPGRPFLGLGWNLAAVFGGGSVVGYYVFMFSSLVLSAIMVYSIVVTLLPNQPVWAFLGSALKLVWSANFEVFENHSVAIYFAELQFWLATFLFVRLAVSRTPPRRFEVVLAPIGIVGCLVTAAGTYQTAWPVMLLPPLVLIASGFMKWKSRRTFLLLSLWYLSTLPMMLWCGWLSYRHAQKVSPSFLEIFDRLCYGFREATWDSVLYPFMPDPNASLGVNAYVVLIILMFTLVVVWFGLQSVPVLRKQSRERSTRVIAVLIFTSLAIIVGSLLLPSFLYRPEFGTRFMHWPSVGTIALIVTLLFWLSRVGGQVSGAVSAVLAVVIFSSMLSRMDSVRNSWVESSLTNRRFWEGIVSGLPKVQEGTVILMEGPPAQVGTSDFLGTWIIRALTDTQSTYFITESAPDYQPDSGMYDVSSFVDLNRKTESFDPKMNHYKETLAAVLGASQVFPVAADRVVWLSWDPFSRLLIVDPERSAMDRISKNVRSKFGDLLFPGATTGRGTTP